MVPWEHHYYSNFPKVCFKVWNIGFSIYWKLKSLDMMCMRDASSIVSNHFKPSAFEKILRTLVVWFLTIHTSTDWDQIVQILKNSDFII